MSPYTNTNNTNATSNKTNIGILHQIVGLEQSERDEEKFENSKRVIWCRNSKKDRQYNDQKKRTVKTNNGRHRTLKIDQQ